MSLKISERQVGNVTILDLVGSLTLVEGAPHFRDTLKRLVHEGKKNLLLNMWDLRYIDSSGIGELVSGYTTVTNSGGRLKMMNLRGRARDQLQITKLYACYEVFDNEETALKSFYSRVRYCRCPVCGYRTALPIIGEAAWQPQTCSNCDSRFTVEPVADSRLDVSVRWVQIQSYQGEYVEIVAGSPLNVGVVGRLDLFSSHALQKAWRTLPIPLRVMVALRHATEIADEGRTALLTLVTKPENGAKAVVSLEGLPPEQAATFPAGPPFYTDTAAALMALGDVSDSPTWLVKVDQS